MQSPETTFTPLLLPRRPERSGYRSSFLRRAASRTAPSTSAQRGRGAPSRRNAETSVVSTATCAPWNKRQTVSEDLDATFIELVWHDNVHVLDHHVGGDPPTRFTAHACGCRLHSEPTTPKNPRHSACCSVVALESSNVVCLATGQHVKSALGAPHGPGTVWQSRPHRACDETVVHRLCGQVRPPVFRS